jgi:hypothetical protein
MEGAQFLLEAVLVLLLATTLFHALRLERALGVLKRDRAVLEGLVAGFNESTRAAEAGIDRLRGATDGAGRQIARQIEIAQRLRDDLGFLTDRGESLAERLEGGIRSARMLADQQAMAAPLMTVRPPGVPPQNVTSLQPGSSQAGMARPPSAPPCAVPSQAMPPQHAELPQGGGEAPMAPVYAAPGPAAQPRLRSEAERELLRALRAAR